jgi:hypothetical protein
MHARFYMWRYKGGTQNSLLIKLKKERGTGYHEPLKSRTKWLHLQFSPEVNKYWSWVRVITNTECPRRNVNILGGHGIGHSKQKLYMYMCPMPNGFTAQYTVQTSNTPCPHTSCKVHWCWRWNFRKCIVLGKLYQLCLLNNKYRY